METKFSCPHCQRHLEAGPEYAGMQINCPACNGTLIVPGAPMAAPPPVSAVSSAVAASACPGCAAPVTPATVICMNCGFNLRTGQRVATKKSSDPYSTAWYKTPLPYLGALIVVLGLLYWLGQSNPPMMLAFIGIAALYSFAIHLAVIVVAFKEDGAGAGFMTMCIPFYALYYVMQDDHPNLKILYPVALGLNLAIRFLK
jgi:hypothetical protein